MTAKEIINYMESLRNEEQRRVLMGFFKTGPGEYGEGDEFLLWDGCSERWESDVRWICFVTFCVSMRTRCLARCCVMLLRK